MSFDEKLRALRLENDMTQKYVAGRMNVARSTIAGYETKGRQPSHEKLAAFADLFHVSVDYLLDEKETITLSPSQTPIYPTEELILVEKYQRLSNDSKGDLFRYIHLLELYDKEKSE